MVDASRRRSVGVGIAFSLLVCVCGGRVESSGASDVEDVSLDALVPVLLTEANHLGVSAFGPVPMTSGEPDDWYQEPPTGICDAQARPVDLVGRDDLYAYLGDGGDYIYLDQWVSGEPVTAAAERYTRGVAAFEANVERGVFVEVAVSHPGIDAVHRFEQHVPDGGPGEDDDRFFLALYARNGGISMLVSLYLTRRDKYSPDEIERMTGVALGKLTALGRVEVTGTTSGDPSSTPADGAIVATLPDALPAGTAECLRPPPTHLESPSEPVVVVESITVEDLAAESVPTEVIIESVSSSVVIESVVSTASTETPSVGTTVTALPVTTAAAASVPAGDGPVATTFTDVLEAAESFVIEDDDLQAAMLTAADLGEPWETYVEASVAAVWPGAFEPSRRCPDGELMAVYVKSGNVGFLPEWRGEYNSLSDDEVSQSVYVFESVDDARSWFDGYESCVGSEWDIPETDTHVSADRFDVAEVGDQSRGFRALFAHSDGSEHDVYTALVRLGQVLIAVRYTDYSNEPLHLTDPFDQAILNGAVDIAVTRMVNAVG